MRQYFATPQKQAAFYEYCDIILTNNERPLHNDDTFFDLDEEAL